MQQSNLFTCGRPRPDFFLRLDTGSRLTLRVGGMLNESAEHIPTSSSGRMTQEARLSTESACILRRGQIKLPGQPLLLSGHSWASKAKQAYCLLSKQNFRLWTLQWDSTADLKN